MSWYSQEDAGRAAQTQAGQPGAAQVNPDHGDIGTVPVSALVPIMATAPNRPLRGLARLLIVIGIVFSLLSIGGSIAWVAAIGGAVDFAIEDIEQANEDKGDEIFFDLDEEASNIKGVLDLAGIGVGAVGFALGLVIMVIGGVAATRQDTGAYRHPRLGLPTDGGGGAVRLIAWSTHCIPDRLIYAPR